MIARRRGRNVPYGLLEVTLQVYSGLFVRAFHMNVQTDSHNTFKKKPNSAALSGHIWGRHLEISKNRSGSCQGQPHLHHFGLPAGPILLNPMLM